MSPEEIENKLKDLEARISTLEAMKAIPTVSNNGFNTIRRQIAEQITGFSTKELVMLSLYFEPVQTFSSIKQMIIGWGWTRDTFFEKNFGTTLVNKGLVQKVHNENEKEDQYTLTETGRIEVERMCKKFNLQI